MVAQPAGVDRRRHEVVAERVHRQQRRHARGVAEVVVEAPSVSVGHDDGSTATSRTSASGTNGSAMPPRFEPPPQHADHDVGPRLARERELLLRLEPDDGLVQQHVVEHRAERVVRVVARRGVAHRVADREAERARVVGVVDR